MKLPIRVFFICIFSFLIMCIVLNANSDAAIYSTGRIFQGFILSIQVFLIKLVNITMHLVKTDRGFRFE